MFFFVSLTTLIFAQTVKQKETKTKAIESSRKMLTVLLLCFADLTFAFFYRESTGMVNKNYVYKASPLASKVTDSFFDCNHFCLSLPDCFSFNYESSAEARGLCELHSFHDNVGKEEKSLTFKPGFVFVQTDKHVSVCVYVSLFLFWVRFLSE